VLIAAVAVLVSCSAGSDAAPGTSSTESSSAKVVAAPPVTDASDAPAECVPDDSPGTVRLWHVMGGNVAADLWADFEAEFEAQSDIDLEVTSFGGDIELVKKLAETDAAEWPDIIDVSEQTIRTLVDSEKFVPPAGCDPALGSDLIPIVRATYTVDGELVALPFGVSTLVLVYDRAEYEKAGLDPTAPPRTFDELLAVSAEIVDSGVSGHGLVMSDHCGDLFMEQYPARRNELQSVPGNGRSDRAAHVDYRSPEISADFTALKEAIDAGHVQYIGPNGSGFDDLAQLSPVDGDATMTIHTSAALGDVIDLLAAGNFPGAVLGVSALPGPADGTLVGGNALWLAANGDAAQQGRALTVESWLYQPERLARLAAATGYAPPTVGAANDPLLQQRWKEHPELKVSYDQIVATDVSEATAGMLIGPFDERNRVFYMTCEHAMTGAKSVDTALGDATTAVNDLIASYDAAWTGEPIDSSSLPAVSAPPPVEISGTVSCETGADVVGIWVEAAAGGSGFIDDFTSLDTGGATFTRTLPSGGAYELHVGCGGTRETWLTSNNTPRTAETGLTFLCHDGRGEDPGVCDIV
jgi:sn-glycerol 3-phosphate transport system substrate-binding protein